MYDPYSESINPLTGLARKYDDRLYPNVEHWRDNYIDTAPYLSDVVDTISENERVWIVYGSPHGTSAYTIFRLSVYGNVTECSYADTLEAAYEEYTAMLA